MLSLQQNCTCIIRLVSYLFTLKSSYQACCLPLVATLLAFTDWPHSLPLKMPHSNPIFFFFKEKEICFCGNQHFATSAVSCACVEHTIFL